MPKPRHLDRQVLIDCCKDGTITYRVRGSGTQRRQDAALPVFSVDTVEEAKLIQVTLCRKQYGTDPAYPGERRSWYVLNEFGGELEDLDKVTADMEACYEKIRGAA